MSRADLWLKELADGWGLAIQPRKVTLLGQSVRALQKGPKGEGSDEPKSANHESPPKLQLQTRTLKRQEM